MYYWRLSKNYTLSEAHLWEELVTTSLGVNIHEGRKRGFILARDALLYLLRKQGHDLDIRDLTLKKYCELIALPEYTLSLSHTKNAGAAVIAKKNEYSSIGIDIEHEERIVKADIIGKLAHPNDVKLRNIELWCLKEAVFKCLMNTQNFDKNVDFANIRIEEKKWFHAPSGFEGAWELKLYEHHVVAIATLLA